MRAFFLLGAIIGAGAVFVARDAVACGGCFHERPSQPMQGITVVTDHRMAFAVSKDQTTLYDQIRYQGDPSKFAWVLPIAGTVDVGLSADVLFASLDQITRTVITAPPLPPCPPAPICGRSSPSGGGCGCGFGASLTSSQEDFGASSQDAAKSGSSDSGVVVTKQEVVGPYETVQIKATDPMSLNDWLTMNGYEIPDDVKPIIAAYQQEGFGFLALKLQPGKNVNAMRPVRVTTKGAGLTLPLRMVAAGTGANVGITLWVVAEGKYDPDNFQFFRINTDDLVWDWSTNRSNYTELRAAMTQQSKGTAWEMESSTDVARGTLMQLVYSGGRPFGMVPAENDYTPTDPKDPSSAEKARLDDLDTIFSGSMTASMRITRLRADLAREALVKDFQLRASADQSMIPTGRQPTKDTNRPACPQFPPCPPDPNDNLRGGGACNTATSSMSDFGVGIFALALTATLVRRKTRRKP